MGVDSPNRLEPVWKQENIKAPVHKGPLPKLPLLTTIILLMETVRNPLYTMAMFWLQYVSCFVASI